MGLESTADTFCKECSTKGLAIPNEILISDLDCSGTSNIAEKEIDDFISYFDNENGPALVSVSAYFYYFRLLDVMMNSVCICNWFSHPHAYLLE